MSQSPVTQSPAGGALGVAGQLVVSFTAAALTALLLNPSVGIALALVAAVTVGLGVTFTLQRTLWLVAEALDRLSQGHTGIAIPPRWHGPLAGLVASVNLLAGRDRELYDLRRGLLDQTREAAAQEERNRLARELHDSIKQQIFSISMSTAAAQARSEADPEGAREALADARRSAQEAMVEMNALLQQLSPIPLEKVGLVAALRDQCAALGYRTGAEVTVTIGDLPGDDRLPPGSQESLFRIVQEALSNIARHARAQNVKLRLGLENADGPLALVVTDDGQGFKTAGKSSGMGLTNIRQRAAALRGEVALKSAPGKGTTLRINVPLLKSLEIAEEKMAIKLDHTLNKVFLVGLVGGLLVTAALFYPLYVDWPGRYLSEWMEGSQETSLVFEIIAAALLLATGYVAANWARPGTRGVGLLYGVLASGVAALLASFIIVGPAAGVAGAQQLLQWGLRPASDEAHSFVLLVDPVVRIIYWSFAGLWAAVLGGVGLGAIGGVVAPVTGVKPTAREVIIAGGTIATIAWIVSLLALIVQVALFSLLEPSVIRAVAQMEHYSTIYPVQGVTLWPIGTALVFELATLLVQYGTLRAAYRASIREVTGGPVSMLVIAALTLAAGVVMMLGIFPFDHPVQAFWLVGAILHVCFASGFGWMGVAMWREARAKGEPVFGVKPSTAGAGPAMVTGLAGSGLAALTFGGLFVYFIVANMLTFLSSLSVRAAIVVLTLALMARVLIGKRFVGPPDTRPLKTRMLWAAIGIPVLAIAAFIPGLVAPLAVVMALVGIIMVIRSVALKLGIKGEWLQQAARDFINSSVNMLLGTVVTMAFVPLVGIAAPLNLVLLVIPAIQWVSLWGDMESPPVTTTVIEMVQTNYLFQAQAVLYVLLGFLIFYGVFIAVGRGLLALIIRREKTQDAPAEQSAS